MTPDDDIDHMRHALSLARRGLGRVWPNPAVGCVIVRDGVIVGRGRTADGGRPHAEPQALAQAGDAARGATAYVSLEPCSHHGKTPPCAEGLIKAGVARVVVACTDPDPRVSGRGIAMLQAAGIAVTIDVCASEAQALNRGFFLTQMRDRPLITLKIATSGDGKIAPQEGARMRITGDESHRYAHDLRSRYDAILIGSGTALVDDPMLTTRVRGLRHDLVRVVMDSDLRLPLTSQLVQSARDYPLWVCHRSRDEERIRALEDAGAVLLDGGMDIADVSRALARRGITRLLVEGGAKIWNAFLSAGLYDDLYWFKAPEIIIGEGGVEALMGHDMAHLSQDFGLELEKTMVLGKDSLAIYARPAYSRGEI